MVNPAESCPGSKEGETSGIASTALSPPPAWMKDQDPEWIKDQDQGLKSNQVLTLFGNILFENASVLPGSSHTETSQLIVLTFQSSFLNLCIALVSPSRAAHQLPQPRLSAGFVLLVVAALD